MSVLKFSVHRVFIVTLEYGGWKNAYGSWRNKKKSGF